MKHECSKMEGIEEIKFRKLLNDQEEKEEKDLLKMLRANDLINTE